MGRGEIQRKFDEIVEFAEVARFLDTPVKRYSSGMYLRLAFAVAAHLEPEILIVDEVLAVGDIGFQKKCLGKIGGIARSGRTVLFVSHNMAAVQNLCDRVVLLAGGKLEHTGPPVEVLETYLRGVSGGASGVVSLDGCRAIGSIPIIRRIVLRGADERESTRFLSGSELRIEIDYDAPSALVNPVFGVMVEDFSGVRLFYLQTLSQHGPIPSLPRRGSAVCRIPRLALIPGTYSMSIFCSDRHTPGELDALERAVFFDVEEADYFGTGSLPPSTTGPLLVDATWSFDGSESVHDSIVGLEPPVSSLEGRMTTGVAP
jgi:lipopolysaccharide transport system ATP-binding protein